MLGILFGAALCSFIVGVLLIRYQHIHEHFSADHDLDGIQKFHQIPVPRVGGIALAIGLTLGVALLYRKYWQIEPILILCASSPAFIAGIIEDTTKKVSARMRLLASAISALLGTVLLNALLSRVDIPYIDAILVTAPLISILFTTIAVSGVAHAINIIDGYNGLSSMVAMMITMSLAYVCFKVNDSLLLGFCFATVGSLAGFFLLNYPKGYIFAGDGGAYLMGFLIAEISVLLVARHPEVSAWFPLLVVGYPVFETLFSIYRKKYIRGISPGVPDGLHLHMLVYKRFVRWMTDEQDVCKIRQNSMTSPYLWFLAAMSIIPATYFWNNTPALIICALIFAILYISFYRMIILFKTPSWLRQQHRR